MGYSEIIFTAQLDEKQIYLYIVIVKFEKQGITMPQYKYTVIFEPAEEGGYIAHVPALGGIVTEGDTLEEAEAMAIDLIKGYIETLNKKGLPIPEETIEAEPSSLSLRQVAVAI